MRLVAENVDNKDNEKVPGRGAIVIETETETKIIRTKFVYYFELNAARLSIFNVRQPIPEFMCSRVSVPESHCDQLFCCEIT
jgi:hypothetical protein